MYSGQGADPQDMLAKRIIWFMVEFNKIPKAFIDYIPALS